MLSDVNMSHITVGVAPPVIAEDDKEYYDRVLHDKVEEQLNTNDAGYAAVKATYTKAVATFQQLLEASGLKRYNRGRAEVSYPRKGKKGSRRNNKPDPMAAAYDACDVTYGAMHDYVDKYTHDHKMTLTAAEWARAQQ